MTARERALELLLLGGAILALGVIAVSLLPGTPATSWLRLGIYVLLATPWAAVGVYLMASVVERAWRRVGLLGSLMVLAALSLW